MKHLLFLALIAATFSCKKKDINYNVDGTVTDLSFSQPLSGASVKLYEVPLGASTEGKLVASVTTGSDGKYTFEFERSKIEKYRIIITKDLYFSQTLDFTSDQLDTKKTVSFNAETTAMAWVRLHFANGLTLDDISYTKQDGKQNCDECCPIDEQHFYHVADTSIYCINDGNKPYGVFYQVTGKPVNGEPSVITVPFDTTDLLINY